MRDQMSHDDKMKTVKRKRRIPAMDPLPEDTKPLIDLAVRDQEIRFLSAAESGDSNNEEQCRPLLEKMSVDLMRKENPRYAYKKLEGKVPKVLGHAQGWGVVEIGIILHRSSSNNEEENHGLCFQQTSTSRDNDEYVAIKTLRKNVVERYLRKGGHENPYTEILRMQQLGDNYHVLKCIEALEDDEFLYIIMPYCGEGSLKDNITWAGVEDICGTTTSPGYSEEKARQLFRQILEILCYLKRHGICHHDISPDNFMFYRGRLVLFDFAMSLRVPKDQFGHSYPIKPQGQFGTFAYQAPEVFLSKGSFDGFNADLWSATSILYNMLTGHILYYLPSPVDINFRFFLLAQGLSRNPNNPLTAEILMDTFHENNSIRSRENQEALYSRIRANAKIPHAAMELLENLLAIHPANRWSVEQVMGCSWLNP